MKKTFTIITLSMLVLLLNLFSVVNAETQKIWGECTAKSQSNFVITTENGNITATDGTGKGFGFLGFTGWYTIEDGVITSFEEIPEYGFEIGYLSKASTDFSGGISVDIYTNEKSSIALAGNIKIDGTSYRLNNSAQEVAELLDSNTGFIGYKTETYLDEETNEVLSVEINNIIFIESKHTEYDKSQSDFANLTYKITENTQFYFSSEDGIYHQTGELPTEEYYWSFDVMSYDKDYNARVVAVNAIYSKDVAFYSHTMGHYQSFSGYILKAVNKKGVQTDFPLEEEYSYSGIIDALADFDGIIEYKMNSEGFITEIIPLTSIAGFADEEVSNGKIGDYIIDDIVAFEVIDNGNLWSYAEADLSDQYLYSGNIYTTSENKTVLWIYSKSIASGNPIVDFSARDRVDRLRVIADIDLNGYTGGGFTYIAVYKANKLVGVFSFDLTDINGITADYDEIRETILYGENETSNDFTVRGFVWNEHLSPLAPATDVAIK